MLLFALLAGCKSGYAGGQAFDSSTSESGHTAPTPGAPDELCPGPLDPARVYVAVAIRSGNQNTSLVYPVDAPELACAYEYKGAARHPFVGVDGGLLEMFADDESVYAHQQAWLQPGQYSTMWHAFADERSLVANLGCAIGESGDIFIRQRQDGELGFFCDSGIGEQWVYDRPADDTPLALEVQLVAPLPYDRWLVATYDGEISGLAALQGDGQQIPLTLGDGLEDIIPVAARSTAGGALVAAYAGEGLQLLEVSEGIVATRAVYEHAEFFEAPPLGLIGDNIYPPHRPAIGADGTLGYIDLDAIPSPRAMWLRPDTAPAVAAEIGELDTYEVIEILDVLSQ